MKDLAHTKKLQIKTSLCFIFCGCGKINFKFKNLLVFELSLSPKVAF